MKQVVCGVFDRAAQLFGRPIFCATTAQATRSFKDEINRADSEMGRHPDDFDLFLLATFDDNTGVFLSDSQLIVRGKDLIEVDNV